MFNINTQNSEDRFAACSNCGEIINIKDFKNRDDIKWAKCGKIGIYIAKAEYVFMV